MALRERRGEPDRGLAPPPPLRGWFDGDARQPGGQDVLVAPLSSVSLHRFDEAKSLLEKTTPLARRVFGESHDHTLRMRWNYAEALYRDDDATLDDLREAVTTLEETTRTARRVLGGAHPVTESIEDALRNARAALCAREVRNLIL